jgi:CRISPR/Cas system-associated protein endoribonuclease Cas2
MIPKEEQDDADARRKLRRLLLKAGYKRCDSPDPKGEAWLAPSDGDTFHGLTDTWAHYQSGFGPESEELKAPSEDMVKAMVRYRKELFAAGYQRLTSGVAIQVEQWADPNGRVHVSRGEAHAHLKNHIAEEMEGVILKMNKLYDAAQMACVKPMAIPVITGIDSITQTGCDTLTQGVSVLGACCAS